MRWFRRRPAKPKAWFQCGLCSLRVEGSAEFVSELSVRHMRAHGYYWSE